MKTVIRLSVLSLVVAMLGACATSGEATTYQPTKFPKYRYVQDTEYIKYYERTAQRRNFVHVNWVNPPMKRVAVQEGDE
ncbi:hypothetical protein [Lysobacter fragariae]